MEPGPGPSQQLVLSKVHPLDDVPTVIKHTTNVLCVHSTREVWITVMPPVSTCCANSLQTKIIVLSVIWDRTEPDIDATQVRFLQECQSICHRKSEVVGVHTSFGARVVHRSFESVGSPPDEHTVPPTLHIPHGMSGDCDGRTKRRLATWRVWAIDSSYSPRTHP